MGLLYFGILVGGLITIPPAGSSLADVVKRQLRRMCLLKSTVSSLGIVLFCLAIPAAPASAQTAEFNPQQVRQVQEKLLELGYRHAPASGIWDDETSNQVNFFRIDAKAPAETQESDLSNTIQSLSERARVISSTRSEVFIPTSPESRAGLGELVASMDERWVAIADNNDVKIWDVRNAGQVESLGIAKVFSADFSNDSRYLAVGVQDVPYFAVGTQGVAIRIWDLEARRFVRSMGVKPVAGVPVGSRIDKIRFRHGTRDVVVADAQGYVVLYNWNDEKFVHLLGRHDESPHLKYHERSIGALSVSFNGKIAASIGNGDGAIKFWSLETRTLLKSLPIFDPKGFSKREGFFGYQIFFDPTGDFAIAARINSDDGKIVRIDMNSFAVTEIMSGSEIGSVYPDHGNVFVLHRKKDSADFSSALSLVQASTGKVIQSTDSDSLGLMAVSRRYDRVTIWGYETFDIFEMSSAKRLNRDYFPTSPTKISSCSKSNTVAIGASNGSLISLWDFKEGRSVQTIDLSRFEPWYEGRRGAPHWRAEYIFCLNQSNQILIADQQAAALLDVGPKPRITTKLSFKTAGDKYTHTPKNIVASSNGKNLIVSKGDGFCDKKSNNCQKDDPENAPAYAPWDLVGGRALRTTGLPRLTSEEIYAAQREKIVKFGSRANEGAMTISKDGRWLVTARDEWRGSLWDLSSGKQVRTFDTLLDVAKFSFGKSYPSDVTAQNAMARQASSIKTLAMADDAKKYFAGLAGGGWYLKSGRNYALMFDFAESSPKKILELGEPSVVLATDSGAEWLASGGISGPVDLINVNTGNRRRLLGHKNGILSLEFSPDKKQLFSSSEDKSLRVWDTATGALSASGFVFNDGEWVLLTPEGFFNASSNGAKRIKFRSGPLEVATIDQIYNTLYRPDLVREKLAGDPDGKVRAAAAKLDLNKVMASGSAPKVVIASPTAGTSSATDEVAVEATVSDQGGGIGKVEWRVNGVTSGIETRGLERIEKAAAIGRLLTVKRTLALERGENRIEVLAYNAKDLIASEPASVTVKWDGERTATPPKLYVMAIGVNDYYDSRLRLSYAVPDATAIAEGFRKAGAGLYAAVDVTTVLDKDVTLANLDKVFTELGKKAQPRDVFVFFLAGHGKTKNGRYYFLPRDFRYEDEDSIEKAGMDQDKFQAWFAKIAARKSILLYDTCESGSLTGTRARGSDIDERLGALNRMTRATGRTFLTATTDDAPALEGYRGHGVFTYALLDALDHADINKNGLIEISELADYIDQKVPDLSFEAFKLRQIPQRNIVGNNFALTNKAAVLVADTAAAAAGSGSPAASSLAVTTPAKPTHVVISAAPIEVFDAASRSSSVVQKLPAGTLVTAIKTLEGWTLVSKDGNPIGYVSQASLAPLH